MTNAEQLFESLRYSERFKLPKYKANLTVIKTPEGILLRSYETFVAELNFDKNTITKKIPFYSVTTSKHINYVMNFFELNLV